MSSNSSSPSALSKTEERTVMGIMIVMVAVYTLKSVWILRRSVLPWLARSCCRLARALYAGSGNKEPEDPDVVRQVAALVALRRVQVSRAALFALWTASCVLNRSFVLRFLANDVIYNRFWVFINVLALVLLTLAGVCPSRCITERSLPFAHVISMTMLCACAFIGLPTEVATQATSGILMLSCLCSLVCLRFPLILATNTCLSVCMIIMFMNSASFQPLRMFLIHEGINFLIKISVAYALGAGLKYSARQEVAASGERVQQGAVSSLLDILCDAVVDMDHRLHMKHHFPKLACMLMHGEGRSLRGTTLADFIPDVQDKSVFAKASATSPDERGQLKPAMVSVRMRDALGNNIKVELFHVPYTSLGGHTHHLVGVREDTDEGAAGGPSALGANGAVLRKDIAHGLKALHRIDEGRRSADVGVDVGNGLSGTGLANDGRRNASSSGRSSNSRSSMGSLEGSHAAGDVEAPDMDKCIIVSIEPKLPVSFATPGAVDALGVQPDALGDLLGDGGQRLLAWLSALARRQASGGGTGDVKECFGSVDFHPVPGEPAEAIRHTVWIFLPEAVGEAAAQRAIIVLSGKMQTPVARDGHAPASTAADIRPIRCCL